MAKGEIPAARTKKERERRMTIDEIIKQRAEGGYVFGERLEKAIMNKYPADSRPKIESVLDIVRREQRTWEMQCERAML